ncbi:DeoR/GlpR family DNA-binding transcription regulator [Aggregatilineales bacterium SYSU G02658]
MTEPLFMTERRRTILEALREQGRVSVNELSQRLQVSAVTIRQDLRALEEERLLERTHGGAIMPRKHPAAPELTFDVRQRERREVKDALARAAARLIQPGHTVALDSSTTIFAMLPYLREIPRLIVVTHSIAISQALLDAPQIQVIMPGGVLRRDSIALVGSPQNLPDIHINSGFFSAHGMTIETGATESSQEEATMKRALMSRCLRVHYLLDDVKWGRVAPFTLAQPSEIHTLFTTTRLPCEAVEHLRQHNVEVEQVSVEAV